MTRFGGEKTEALFALDLSEGPTLGHRSVIAENGEGTMVGKGSRFRIRDILLDPSDANRLWVAPDNDAVFVVDMDSGDRVLVSGFEF